MTKLRIALAQMPSEKGDWAEALLVYDLELPKVKGTR